MTKTIKGDLTLKKDTTFKESIVVEGDIKGYFNLKVDGDLNCRNLDCWDLNCRNLDCRNLNCWDLNCKDLNFYAVAIAYLSFKCKTWKARRDKFVIQCLDGKIVGKELKEKT